MKIEIFEFSKIFARVFPIFGAMSPPLGELISKVEWFFWSRFFCASMSVSELYGKNCLGDVATVYNPEKDLNFFSWQIFPEASIHLPGEREMVANNIVVPLPLISKFWARLFTRNPSLKYRGTLRRMFFAFHAQLHFFLPYRISNVLGTFNGSKRHQNISFRAGKWTFTL